MLRGETIYKTGNDWCESLSYIEYAFYKNTLMD